MSREKNRFKRFCARPKEGAKRKRLPKDNGSSFFSTRHFLPKIGTALSILVCTAIGFLADIPVHGQASFVYWTEQSQQTQLNELPLAQLQLKTLSRQA